MKRIVFPALLLLLQAVSCVTYAQFKTVAQGPVFEEPEKGFARIIQMKNGSTMFFHISIKEGIDVQIYDAKHKQKVSKHIIPKYGKLKMGGVDGIFEINGDATLLISEIDERAPVLYRLIVDGATGNLKQEEQLAALERLTTGKGYAMAFGGVPMPDFYVRKDPNSDNYALATFNSFESDRNKRIEVVQYGADHKEITRAYYASPENKYKYIEYIDMAVLGADKVCVLARGFNTRASGGKESELILATLSKGNKEVALTRLGFSEDLKGKNGITRYNPVTGKVLLLMAINDRKKSDTYHCYLVTIDPNTGKMEKNITLFPDAVDKKSMELFGRKANFEGMPQNLFINSDGSFSIVYEEREIVTQTYTSMPSSTGLSFGSSHSHSSTELGNIAVSNYDKDGKEISSYFMPKRQFLANTVLPAFYHSDRENAAQQLDGGNQFKSFAYLHGKDKSYILFNDVEENTERVQKGDKPVRILGLGDCDGFYYPLQGGDIIPARDFVFGKPAKRSHNMALFAISDYDKEQNLYITLKLEKEGRDKGVRLVWMTP